MKTIQQNTFTETITTGTYSGAPGVPSPITDETDEISRRIEVRRGEVGFISEGVE